MSWYYYTPHDGTKPALAPHQAGLMELIESIEKQYEVPGSVKHHIPLEGEARKLSAEKVWKEEKDFAAGLIIGGWFIKVSRVRELRMGRPRIELELKVSDNQTIFSLLFGRSKINLCFKNHLKFRLSYLVESCLLTSFLPPFYLSHFS